MSKKWPYYHVDCGHFPVSIKLCFSNTDFQRILEDHDIKAKATALDEGVAETHYLSDGKVGIVVMVFDLDECEDDEPANLVGIVAHEATHCVCRVFEHIGEDVEEIGEESRAYLTEHIVKQIWKGIEMEKERRAREADRAVSKQKGKRSKGADVQVDKHSNGSAGQDNNPQQQDPSSGVENSYGGTLGATKTGFQGARAAWANSDHYPEQK
jgi:hypothetical protein